VRLERWRVWKTMRDAQMRWVSRGSMAVRLRGMGERAAEWLRLRVFWRSMILGSDLKVVRKRWGVQRGWKAEKARRGESMMRRTWNSMRA
jgi:hypothetical protein